MSTGMNHPQYFKKSPKNEKNKNHICHNDRSLHAEEVAIDNLRNKIDTKKIIDVSLIVIRITLKSNIDTYTLCDSKPCVICLQRIIDCVKYGFRIKKIYYSTQSGEIICYKLRDLIKKKQYISSFYTKTTIPKFYLKNYDIEQ
jgi:deoxycytidylate deaminase